MTIAYPDAFREKLRGVLGGIGAIEAVEGELTQLHAEAIELFRKSYKGITADIVGMHGHTILHRPAERRTWQLGDGAALAERLGVDVVADFRSADVAAGGEGAPLAPLFHAALAAALPKPVAVLNLGGVANVTWIGEAGAVLAFDTGPGNALIDDWVRRHTGASADFDGALASVGRASEPHVGRFLESSVFCAAAAQIARSRRFPGVHAGRTIGRRRCSDPDRDDSCRRRRREVLFPGSGPRMVSYRRGPAQPGSNGRARPSR